MRIERFETWWVQRGENFFDEKHRGRSKMDWDVVVIKLTADNGAEGIATAMAARSARVTESYLEDNIAPVVLGRSAYEREAIWQDLWNIDRNLTFFPVYLPGPVDVALWDMAAKEAGLPLYKYLGAYRNQLPVYASGLFHDRPEEYVEEALRYREQGIRCYKAHPSGVWREDIAVHTALRDGVGTTMDLMTDPVGEYTLGDAIRVGRNLEDLGYLWFEEPFRDFEINKYTELCSALDIPILATETSRGCHWGAAQAILTRATDLVRADVSWKWGITGTLKIAHLAESFGMNCEMHTTTMNYMDMATLHVACAVRNSEWFEYFVPEDNFRLPMQGNLPIQNGIITVSDRPGVGVELDWELIQRKCVSYRDLRA